MNQSRVLSVQEGSIQIRPPDNPTHQRQHLDHFPHQIIGPHGFAGNGRTAERMPELRARPPGIFGGITDSDLRR
ncbi:hypothetical protein AB4305_21560 [Nocardia sp. 2YAB30]|uniref:hypothetical protein n=1 Tax=unclassified Nocardia TaxID=2637762 RepID=UPI003F94DD46